jgi:hypothetical protein
MPTINAFNSNIPVEISNGGTNATSMATSTGIVKYDGTSLVTSSTAKIDSSNRYTNSSQPCFRAYASLQSDVTGDSTEYTVIFANENFDQGNNFDGTSTFTAPVTGIYYFYVCLRLSGVTASHTISGTRLYKGATPISNNFLNLAAISNTNAQASVVCESTINLAAGDTVTARILVGGGTKVVDISANTDGTYFMGYLIC